METKTKRKYVAPAVLETLWLEMDGPILAESVVTEDTEVESVGQEVIDVGLENSDWNHKWE